MARKKKDNPILWKDRKRILGMPISFTKYIVEDNRLIVRKGLFSTETEETLLYRIVDIKLKRSFGQKLYGVGTITLYATDRSTPTIELKNIKKPDAVRRFLSKIVEQERIEKGLIGREIYGTINTADSGHTHHDFVDIDGDGIPD